MNALVPGRFIDDDIIRLGLSDRIRREHPVDELAVYLIDMAMPKEWRFRASGGPAFSVSLFLEGHGSVCVDGVEPLTIGPGTLVVFSALGHASGENRFAAGGRLRGIDLRFSHDLLRRLGLGALVDGEGLVGNRCGTKDAAVFLTAIEAPHDLRTLVEGLFDRTRAHPAERRLVSMARAIEILSRLPGLLSMDEARVPDLSAGDRKRLLRARHLLSHDFARPWTIPLLARAVGLNERKLKEGFRLLVGETPHAFLRRARLLASAGLLRDGASVTDAATAVGYTNMSHFARIFRAQHGYLPGNGRATRHAHQTS